MLTVARAGLLSTVQDGGRAGVQALGVTPGGAVDDLALQVGNALVGNAPGVAAIEMTLQGMTIAFAADTLVALTGAPLTGSSLKRVTGEAPLPMWRPLWVRRGTLLNLGTMPQGARSYLCVQGGIVTPKILGGAGTDLRNGFGGGVGRALRAGDTLAIAAQDGRYPALYEQLRVSDQPFVAPSWQVSVWRDWQAGVFRPLPLLPGEPGAAWAVAAQQALFSQSCRVLPASDRQGLRLDASLRVAATRQRSAGVCFGLVQLPPDGQPIILLADHQTTGGYPVLGVVASVARSALAQARPGDELRFQPMTLSQAHTALWQREQRLQAIRDMLQWQMRR